MVKLVTREAVMRYYHTASNLLSFSWPCAYKISWLITSLMFTVLFVGARHIIFFSARIWTVNGGQRRSSLLLWAVAVCSSYFSFLIRHCPEEKKKTSLTALIIHAQSFPFSHSKNNAWIISLEWEVKVNVKVHNFLSFLRMVQAPSPSPLFTGRKNKEVFSFGG